MGWPILSGFKVPGGLSITRTTAQTYTNGVPDAPTTSSVSLDPAVIWYMNGKSDRLDVPARSGQARVTVYSEARLQPSADGIRGDRFTYDGVNWEVQTSRYWETAKLYAAEAVKVA